MVWFLKHLSSNGLASNNLSSVWFNSKTKWFQLLRALPSIEMKSLRNLAELFIRNILTIENSFSGLCKRISVALVWKSISADENLHKLLLAIISYFYLGNGSEELLDRSCGSLVVTEIGEVVGFLCFVIPNSKAYYVFIEVLIETGHKLNSIREEWEH